MVTPADAFFVVSAADVAVTVKLLPVDDPAVYKPVEEIVPPVAVHVTAVFELPLTVAVNCCVCPGCSVALVGDMETCTGCWMTTAAVADLVVSATDFAVTVKLPEALPAV